ncbi:MAG: ABC transporter permease [Caldicoprobacterales bacterium]|jgi:putative aldouronate transport system permease protein
MFMSPKLANSRDTIDLSTKKGWDLLFKRIWHYKWIYLFMLMPALLLIILFRYVPMYGVQLAFKTYKLSGIASSPWVGFTHFNRMFVESGFWQAVKNTIMISALKILIGFPFPIILAILLNEITLNKYKRTLQTIYTFPHFLSWVVVAGLILNLLGDSGAVKKIAVLLNPGLADKWNLLYNSSVFRLLLVLSDIWKEGGWGTILYLASITAIDPSLFEAATIDGCNRFQKIIYVTLPGMMGVIIVMFILSAGNIMNANFDQVFNLYSPPVYKVGDILDTYIYRLSFQSSTVMDFGFSTAVGLFKSVINFVLLTTVNYLARAMGSDGIM